MDTLSERVERRDDMKEIPTGPLLLIPHTTTTGFPEVNFNPSQEENLPEKEVPMTENEHAKNWITKFTNGIFSGGLFQTAMHLMRNLIRRRSNTERQVDTRVKESEEATSNEELSQVSPKEDSELIVRLPLLATDIVKVNENVKALSSDEDSESATEHAYLREKLDDSLSIDNVELKLTVGAALGVEDPEVHEDFSTGALERANPDRITLTPTEFKGARAATGVRKRKRSSAEPGQASPITPRRESIRQAIAKIQKLEGEKRRRSITPNTAAEA